MDDAKKQSRWAKTLDQAGLLDEIEDGWTLSGEADDPGASIRVDGAGGESIPPLAAPSVPPPPEERPVTLKQGAIDIAIVDDFQRTPIERHRSSNPAPNEKSGESRPSIEVASARSTHTGIPRPSRVPQPPAREVGASPASPHQQELAPHSEPEPEVAPARKQDHGRKTEPALKSRLNRETPDDGRVVRERVSIAKTRISVAPSAERNWHAEEFQPIIDEPPIDSRSHGRPSRAPRSGVDPRRARMAERMELGDYSGALEAAEEILGASSGDVEATSARDECRRILVKMYEARIGAFERVPKMAVTPHELIWRNLDASTGFVLSRIDGMSSFEDVVDISGLSRFETCRILSQLLQDGIIR
jgi:hypothetical protein